LTVAAYSLNFHLIVHLSLCSYWLDKLALTSKAMWLVSWLNAAVYSLNFHLIVFWSLCSHGLDQHALTSKPMQLEMYEMNIAVTLLNLHQIELWR
jgi:hypothetical protein